MNLKLLKKSKRFRQDAGIALLTTLLLLFLMSSLLVGFAVLLVSNQQLAGANNDQVVAFYAAEAGMEKMTADLGNLFSQTYSPGINQINALETAPYGPPLSSIFPGESVSYATADGTPAYTITPDALDKYGNPAATPNTIKSGPYQGMNALATTYTLSVDARTSMGSEVNLVRTTQTTGIPMFQFAMFCQVDCSFHAGDNYTVAGRVHGNGNLFLSSGSGATLQMQGKVDAYKDIIRAYMDNGASTSANWPGTVSITTGGGYRNLALTEGSVNGTTCISGWQTVSTGNSPTDYASNLINGKGSPNCASYSTGADLLNLAIVTMGNGTTYPIDLIRRPVSTNESATVTGERYMAQSSLVILLSDNSTDITSLPCVEGTPPMDLSVLAQPVANWLTTGAYQTLENDMAAYGTTPLPLAASGSVNSNLFSSTDGYWLPQNYPIVKGYIKIQAQTAYGAPCGTWQDVTAEVLALGYVGRNINPVPQSLNGTSLNPQWNPNTTLMQTGVAPALPIPPTTGQLGYQGSSNTANSIPGAPNGNFSASSVSSTTNPYACPEPHPNAIIRLARIRDNPSSVYYNSGALRTTNPTNYPYYSTVQEACGTASAGVLAQTRSGVSTGGVKGTASTWIPQPYDFWNNTLFDPREGELRDTIPANPYNNLPTLNGTMHYIELDVGNLVKWFAGTIGTSGHKTYDSAESPNDFSVYISDRRGNYTSIQYWTGTWPPLSPSGHETGEYGWNDSVNSVSDPTNGCPNKSLDTGEDLDSVNQLFTYGALSANTNYIMDPGLPTAENSLYTMSGSKITGTNTTTGGLNGTGAYGEYGFYSGLVASAAILANPNCSTTPTYASATPGIWPMMYAAASNSARENPPIFFRRAVKITDAAKLTGLGTCPSGVACGLAIATENPVYMQGDYNADYSNPGTSGFTDASVGSSVAADAVTILSNNWNDVNSFSYNIYGNGSGTANARVPSVTYWRAAVIAGKGVSFPQYGTDADNGTDGGMHNFLRYVENWGNNNNLTVNYEGALVNMYTNRQGTGIFKYGNTVYTVPTRVASFDSTFLTPADLPPRTPMFRSVNTTGWTRLLAPQSSTYK